MKKLLVAVFALGSASAFAHEMGSCTTNVVDSIYRIEEVAATVADYDATIKNMGSHAGPAMDAALQANDDKENLQKSIQALARQVCGR